MLASESGWEFLWKMGFRQREILFTSFIFLRYIAILVKYFSKYTIVRVREITSIKSALVIKSLPVPWHLALVIGHRLSQFPVMLTNTRSSEAPCQLSDNDQLEVHATDDWQIVDDIRRGWNRTNISYLILYSWEVTSCNSLNSIWKLIYIWCYLYLN